MGVDLPIGSCSLMRQTQDLFYLGVVESGKTHLATTTSKLAIDCLYTTKGLLGTSCEKFFTSYSIFTSFSHRLHAQNLTAKEHAAELLK